MLGPRGVISRFLGSMTRRALHRVELQYVAVRVLEPDQLRRTGAMHIAPSTRLRTGFEAADVGIIGPPSLRSVEAGAGPAPDRSAATGACPPGAAG